MNSPVMVKAVAAQYKPLPKFNHQGSSGYDAVGRLTVESNLVGSEGFMLQSGAAHSRQDLQRTFRTEKTQFLVHK